jgi:FKBP-type peptidyl-prolyl cis-trans isomerase FklB
MSIGENFRHAGVTSLDTASFVRGVSDVLSGLPLELGYAEAKEIVTKYFTKLKEDKVELTRLAGEEFLRINKVRAGVMTLPSGLQYEVIRSGSGRKPGISDRVRCHYHGTLINGLVFDSSVERGEPAVFGVSQVIRGWVEALQLMGTGAKWRLFLPSELAYGAAGAGELIDPHSVLIFEVELLDII